MAHRKPRKARLPVGDPTDPEGFPALVRAFLEHLAVRNYSLQTVANREAALSWFASWCSERGLTRPRDITRPILERYQRHLFYARKRDGRPLSFQSQKHRLAALRGFFRWLVRSEHLLHNPASELELPRPEHRLPRSVLRHEEVERILALPDFAIPLGLRDRALLEVLYATGIRRGELVGLGLYDLDLLAGTAAIRLGKGKKDRVVPVGERALAWTRKYLDEVRPLFVAGHDPGALFLTVEGQAFTPDHLSDLVRAYVRRADLGKSGACHLFRHAAATAMLENGADIRFIQELLGHANLTTTQIYTQVSIAKLQEIHAATHPGARLGREDPDPEEETHRAASDLEHRALRAGGEREDC